MVSEPRALALFHVRTHVRGIDQCASLPLGISFRNLRQDFRTKLSPHFFYGRKRFHSFSHVLTLDQQSLRQPFKPALAGVFRDNLSSNFDLPSEVPSRCRRKPLFERPSAVVAVDTRDEPT